MEVLLLGTGGPRGWPEPGCPCASCATAVRARTSRAPACVLVDDGLLLDGHEGVERAAARAGRDLRHVRRVLLTAVPERPPRWLDAVGGAEPVQVHGPAAALAALSSIGDRVQLVPAAPGHSPAGAGGHEVRAFAHGDGLAWEVSDADGRRLMYAPGAGPLDPARPPAAGERPYDLVLLGLGSQRGPGAAADGAAPTLAQLRRDGLVQATTDVRVIGYDHDAPLPDVLQHHLTGWGAGGPDDGSVVRLGPRPLQIRPLSGRTLVLGGVRSGKSALAEQLLAAHPHVTYLATGGMRADDAEWQRRVATHRARRPPSWRTVETTDVTACLRGGDGAVLLDCLGTWLTALLDRHDVWAGGSTTPVEAEVEELLAAWRTSPLPLVAVSNEVGSGVVPATPSGRLFRDLLGRLNAQVAAESEHVLLTVAGVPLALRAPARG